MNKSTNIKDYCCDIVIVAGQSNAQGNGKGGTVLPICEGVYELSDVNPIRVYDSPTRIGETELDLVMPVQTVFKPLCERFDGGECVADLSPTFANNYVADGNLAKGRVLLIVKASVGGTGFAKKQWGVGNILSDRMFQMVDLAVNANNGNKVVAFLWHQGEHDAFEKPTLTPTERHNNYVDSFTRQINAVRNKYGDIPVVCGGFVDDWANKNKITCDAVELALIDSCKLLGNASFVSSNGLLSNDQAIGNGDDIHFCRESLYKLGTYYYKAWKKLINND